MQPVQDHCPGAARQADALDDVRDGADLRVVRAVLGHEQHAIVVTDVGSDGDVHVGKTTASSTETSNRSLSEAQLLYIFVSSYKNCSSDDVCRVHWAWRYERCARSSRCRRRRRWRVGPPTSSASGCATASRSEERSRWRFPAAGRPRACSSCSARKPACRGRPSTSTRPTSASRRVTIRSATSLLENALPLARIHPMPVEAIAPPPWRATKPPCRAGLDLVHLGLGPDGHTASLVPDCGALKVRDRDIAISREYEGRRRMTLTYPCLDRAREFFVGRDGRRQAGGARAAAVRRRVDPRRRAYEHSSRR